MPPSNHVSTYRRGGRETLLAFYTLERAFLLEPTLSSFISIFQKFFHRTWSISGNLFSRKTFEIRFRQRAFLLEPTLSSFISIFQKFFHRTWSISGNLFSRKTFEIRFRATSSIDRSRREGKSKIFVSSVYRPERLAFCRGNRWMAQRQAVTARLMRIFACISQKDPGIR